MNDQTLHDILRRLQRLEQTMVRYRTGEVTDVNPLDVALGGSDVSYENVQAVGPITDSAQVAALLWGNDMLVLGNLNGGIRFGVSSVTFSASNLSTTVTIPHGLGHIPGFIATQSLDRSGKVSPAAGATDTSFDASARYDSSTTGTLSFYWVVMG